MELIIREERNSFITKKNESNDSQNIIGSIKKIQNALKDEEEYNKEEIIEVFNEVSQIKVKKKKKTVTFENYKNLVTVINVESYKKYNVPIEIGANMKKKKKFNSNKKSKKDSSYINENDFDYLDLNGNSGNSCFIF